jgi:hypothetical protein
MKETKYYCDMCGKEIEGIVEVVKAKYIPIQMNFGKHGEYKKKTMVVMDDDRSYMDFCEDCKGTIAVLFGGKSNE